jgi:signal transduction histidine kinase
MKFRHKILLSIWGVVLSLLVITFFIINYWTRSRIEDAFSEELRSNRSTLNGIVGLEAEILARGCQVIAESPRLRAVVELQDPTTAFQLSQELNQTTVSDLFVLTDRTGKSLVELISGQRGEGSVAGKESIQQALRSISATDVWELGGKVFHVASVPLVVDRDVIGTLTLGFAITAEELARLKQWTNKSEILLAQNQKVVLSTLGVNDHGDLLTALANASVLNQTQSGDSAGGVFKLKVSDDVFLGTMYQLSAPSSSQEAIQYLIVKSTHREISRSLNPILGTFGFISLVFLVLTTLIGYAIAGGITKPINELVRGTTEVAKGNYDFVIAVSGKDEVGFLAQRFGDMSKSLKEKIDELGRLNQDLLGRNKALDETLQKLKEAQEELVKSERLAATGKLTAQLAHEINNPVHNIQSCLKTSLGRLPKDIQGRDLIEVAYEEIARMSKLTRQLLDFYRTSFVPEEMRRVDLNNVVKETVSGFGAELSTAGITVELNLQDSLPPIHGSADKLKQVLLNIFLNAKDAMPEGGFLKISSGESDGMVQVIVSDTGVGIPKENIGKIFDAFFTTKSKVSGVGLGLSVSYGIISQHRGTINVTSSAGKGSTFTISLPLYNGEQASTTT